MTIAIDIVREVERCLADFGPAATAHSVTVEVGALRAVVPDALEFCFQAASTGTAAAGARLVVERTPVMVRCDACDDEWSVDSPLFLCRSCEGPVTVLSGKELILRAIEVDDGTD